MQEVRDTLRVSSAQHKELSPAKAARDTEEMTAITFSQLNRYPWSLTTEGDILLDAVGKVSETTMLISCNGLLNPFLSLVIRLHRLLGCRDLSSTER